MLWSTVKNLDCHWLLVRARACIDPDNQPHRDDLVATIMSDVQVPADLFGRVSTSCSRSLS
ncbi:hypothetical protein CO656_23385 [Sinorhizobium sp. FG01]|nr:hypothetical protein CO656_23385 [Sinorhizobium sp. FG01]